MSRKILKNILQIYSDGYKITELEYNRIRIYIYIRDYTIFYRYLDIIGEVVLNNFSQKSSKGRYQFKR